MSKYKGILFGNIGIFVLFVEKDLSLLARLESAYSLIWGAREIWGKSGGETLALL